ncbi:MAG: helix-hairpin-helix domain-containing protein [Chloroflexota bacterium]|jgi:competence protein ComEA
MLKLTKEQLPWLVVALFIGIAIGALAVALSGRMRPAPIIISPPGPTSTPIPDPTQAPLKVHLSGEVAVPAVYELPPGAILQDAIEAAGGLTAAAAADVVNLALPLTSGMHIHIPAADQVNSSPEFLDRSGSLIVPSESPDGQLINLNTATLAELEQLPGIGPSTAQKIIDYRQANGPFATVEDIQNVSGIGPGKLEQIRDLVTVD